MVSKKCRRCGCGSFVWSTGRVVKSLASSLGTQVAVQRLVLYEIERPDTLCRPCKYYSTVRTRKDGHGWTPVSRHQCRHCHLDGLKSVISSEFRVQNSEFRLTPCNLSIKDSSLNLKANSHLQHHTGRFTNTATNVAKPRRTSFTESSSANFKLKPIDTKFAGLIITRLLGSSSPSLPSAVVAVAYLLTTISSSRSISATQEADSSRLSVAIEDKSAGQRRTEESKPSS